MELDDLKNMWEEVQAQTAQQHTIHYKMIDKMTQTKYTSSMKKIAYPELIGTVISYFGVAYMVLHFDKLNSIFLQSLGIVVIALLLVLPAISLAILWQLNKIGNVGRPYVETLKKFAVEKIRFYKFQKLCALLSYVLLGAFIILMPRFFGGKTLNENKYFWSFTVAFGYIFLYFFSRWVLKKYSKALGKMEILLKEIDA